MDKDFFDSLKNQGPAIVLVVALLWIGWQLLSIDNSLKGPAGVGGSICIGLGVIFALNIALKYYKLEEYERIIKTQRTTITGLQSDLTGARKYAKELKDGGGTQGRPQTGYQPVEQSDPNSETQDS